MCELVDLWSGRCPSFSMFVVWFWKQVFGTETRDQADTNTQTVCSATTKYKSAQLNNYHICNTIDLTCPTIFLSVLYNTWHRYLTKMLYRTVYVMSYVMLPLRANKTEMRFEPGQMSRPTHSFIWCHWISASVNELVFV